MYSDIGVCSQDFKVTMIKIFKEIAEDRKYPLKWRI